MRNQIIIQICIAVFSGILLYLIQDYIKILLHKYFTPFISSLLKNYIKPSCSRIVNEFLGRPLCRKGETVALKIKNSQYRNYMDDGKLIEIFGNDYQRSARIVGIAKENGQWKYEFSDKNGQILRYPSKWFDELPSYGIFLRLGVFLILIYLSYPFINDILNYLPLHKSGGPRSPTPMSNNRIINPTCQRAIPLSIPIDHTLALNTMYFSPIAKIAEVINSTDSDVESQAISSDGYYLAVAHTSGDIEIFEAFSLLTASSTEEIQELLESEDILRNTIEVGGENIWAESLVYGPVGDDTLILGKNDGTVDMIEIFTGTLIKSRTVSRYPITYMSEPYFSDGSYLIFYRTENGDSGFLNADTLERYSRTITIISPLAYTTLSRDEKKIAYVACNGDIGVLKIDNLEIINQRNFEMAFYQVSFSIDSQQLLIGTQPEPSIWNFNTDQLQTLPSIQNTVGETCNGELVFLGFSDSEIIAITDYSQRIWTTEGEPVECHIEADSPED